MGRMMTSFRQTSGDDGRYGQHPSSSSTYVALSSMSRYNDAMTTTMRRCRVVIAS